MCRFVEVGRGPVHCLSQWQERQPGTSCGPCLPLHSFLSELCCVTGILLTRVDQDRLVYEKVALAHAGYLLSEVYRVEFEVIACLLLRHRRLLRHVQILGQGRHFVVDEVGDVLGVDHGLFVDLLALLVLRKQRLAQSILVGVVGLWDSADGRARLSGSLVVHTRLFQSCFLIVM